MNQQKYKFTTVNNHVGYNPEKKIFKFYQICHFKHPKTGKYHVRKCIYNENYDLISVTEKTYTISQIKKFFELYKENEYKTYGTYDLQLIDFPSGELISASQSTLLNNNNDNYGYAPFN
jgi:hypothetical protein